MFFLRIIALVFIITLAFRRLKCSHFYGLMLSADQDEDPNTGIVTITLHWRLAFNPSSTTQKSNTVNTCDPCPSGATSSATLSDTTADCTQKLTDLNGQQYESLTGDVQVGWYLSANAPKANQYALMSFDYLQGSSWECL